MQGRTGGIGLGQAIRLRLGNVVVLVKHDAVKAVRHAPLAISETEEGHIRLALSIPAAEDLPAGLYLLFLSPTSAPEAGPGAEQEIQSACGFFSALVGPNATHSFIYEFHIDPATGQESFPGPAFRTPSSWPKPLLTAGRLMAVEAAYQRILAMPTQERRRVLFSLHWFEKAIRGTSTDAVLAFWIAVEALVMETPNIISLKQRVAEIYGEPPKEVSERYFLWRLFKLRSDIVHEGATGPVNAGLLDYMAALYTDLLQTAVGLPCPFAAKRMREEISKELPNWIKAVVSP